MYIYSILILLTLLASVAAMGAIYITSFEKDTHGKRYPWRALLFIPVIWIGIVFGDTSVINYDDVAKHSTEKGHTVYTNNINPDVTITTDDMTLNPKKLITKDDKKKLFNHDRGFFYSLVTPSYDYDDKDITITATNKQNSTSKEAILTKDNFIEKWPKGAHRNSKGRITKIEYRSTPVTLKWFGMKVQKTTYDEARITVEYGATGDESTKQLFGEN